MANFIRIGDEVINLDNLIRIERGRSGDRDTVLLYFVGDQRSQSQYTDEQAAAIWERFTQLADTWDVPEPTHHAPAGAGRVARPT
jgi:hypothetical protein